MTVHHVKFGGGLPPSEAPVGGAPGVGPRADGVIADARGPLRRALERLLFLAFAAVLVTIGLAVGAAIAVFALAVFVAWATLYAAWRLWFAVVPGAVVGLVYAAGWL